MTKMISKKAALSLSVDQLYEHADKNDPRALNTLGNIYNDGSRGVEGDIEKALGFYERAAALGYVSAYINLANLYSRGRGVEQDKAKAAELLTQACAVVEAKAAAGENVSKYYAHYQLGLAYYNGTLVEQDLTKARSLAQQSVNNGYIDSALLLAYMMENGEGGEVDIQGAIANYEIAATKGKKPAAYSRLYNLHSKNGYNEQDNAKRLNYLEKYIQLGGTSPDAHYFVGLYHYPSDPNDADQLAKRNTKAAWHIRKAANEGHAKAQFTLGLMHRDGAQVSKDMKLALKFFNAAADQNNAEALKELAVIYYRGNGVEANAELSNQYHWRAQEIFAERDFQQGLNYLNGTNVARDTKKAFAKFSKAYTETHHRPSMYYLGTMTRDGIGTERDIDLAVNYLKHASGFHEDGYRPDHGYGPAQIELAYMYLRGQDIPQSHDKAIPLAAEALKKEVPGAAEILQTILDENRARADQISSLEAQLRIARLSETLASRARFALNAAPQRASEVLMEPVQP